MSLLVTKNLYRLAGAAAVAFGAIALPAKANTITFIPTNITKPLNNPNPAQALPVDMASSTTAIPPSGSDFSVRFENVFLQAAGTGLFAGVTGTQRVGTPTPNAFRVDYNSSTSDVTGFPNFFLRNLNATFTPFFLTGSCAVCGMSNVISITTLASSEAVQGGFNGLTSSGFPTQGIYTIFTNSPISFTFAGAGLTGTLSYEAITNFTPTSSTSEGSFTMTVPGPSPVIGAALAFGWSRKLRKRIKVASVQAV